jgi:hypothetical protein
MTARPKPRVSEACPNSLTTERALERERSGAQWNGVTEFYEALPIRALEPPSGEGE